MKFKKWLKDFISVTPKEWVAVQLFCASMSAIILSSYDKVAAVFGPDDDALKSISKYVAYGLLVIAGLAQFKTKK